VERKGCTVKVSTREGEKYRKWEKYALAMGKYGGFATAFRAIEVYKGITSCPYSAEKTPGSSYRKIVRGGAYSAIWRILSYTHCQLIPPEQQLTNHWNYTNKKPVLASHHAILLSLMLKISDCRNNIC
jgi:hypothetical protein